MSIKLIPGIVTLLVAGLATLTRADGVDRFAKDQMAKLQIPGMVFGVVRDGKLIRKSCYGLSDVELHVKIRSDDRFELGSITKQFTAAATFMLVDDGKLALSDTVSRFIPEAPPAWQGVTVYQLLHHTSGLPEYALTDGLRLTEEFTRKQFFEKLSATPVDFHPGETWAYSNTNFALLGWIIEKCSGVPYTTFVTDRVLKPLGMSQTRFNRLYDVIEHRAHGYLNTQKTLRRAQLSAESIDSDGSLMSTVEDLAKWDAALAAHKLLSEQSYKDMWTPAVLNSGRKRFYGAGWFLPPYSSLPYVGHPGNSSGFSAGIARFTAAKLTVIVLTNVYAVDGEGLARQIAWIVDPSLRPSPTVVMSDPDPGRTAQVQNALAQLAASDANGNVLEPEVAVTLNGTRAKSFSPYSAFKKIEKLEFCNATPYGQDTLLHYKIKASGKPYEATLLWSNRNRLAHAILIPS